MEPDEQIQTHILSVWCKEKKFFKPGVEGMLFLTQKQLMFVTKTEAKMKWWAAAVERQIRNLLESKNIMLHHDGYNEKELNLDLQNKKNMEIPFDKIVSISSEEKSWGNTLDLEIKFEDKIKKYQFSIVSGWVKYPAKDPIKYMKVDWVPFVEFVKKRQRLE